MSQLREHENLVDIVARAVPNERLDLETLKNVNIYTRSGTVVPLAEVAKVKYGLEEPVLWRRNRDMAITVRADVKDGEQAVSVTKEIDPLLKDIRAALPAGYRVDVGGAVEESDTANQALAAVAPVMVLTILLILMLQLQSFSKMAMVFLTAPLGLIGVVAALLVFRRPARLRGDPGHHRARRDDHAQLGDPDRPGAHRDGRGPRCVERHRGRGPAPHAPGGTDRGGDRAGDDPAHAQRVLGPDGARDHGRPDDRHGADHLLRARAVRGVVQGAPRVGWRHRVSARQRRAGGMTRVVRSGSAGS